MTANTLLLPKINTLLLACVIVLLPICIQVAAAGQLLLTNGKIYTQDKNNPWAQAILIEDDKIVFVGKDKDAKALADQSVEILDIKDRLVLPGLHDVHMHPLEASNLAAGACLLEAGRDPESYKSLFEDCRHYQEGTDWIMGWGHYVDDLLETDRMAKEILDDSFPDQPALMMGFTSHTYWANSKALELAGIDANSPDPIGGIIVKDETTGEPTGILLDNAGIIVEDLALRDTRLLRELAFAGLSGVMKTLNRYGLTSIADARVFWNRGHHEVWKQLAEEDLLTVRATLGLWAYPEYEDDYQLTQLKSFYDDNADSLLKISQIKFYADGIPGVGTAAMHDPYRVDYGWIEGNRGLNYFTPERLAKYIKVLEPVGYDAHIHAIGDRGIHESLNAIEAAQNPDNDPRHRLTHLELLADVDVPRFKELGVIADFQVAGDWSHPHVYEEEDWILGDRAYDAIPVRKAYDAGAKITLSSDFDVSDMNPFVGIQNALTRGQESLLTVEMAVAAYTLNAAYALRQDHQTGSLESGKYADLIILDRDIFEIDFEEIAETQVMLTLLGGETVYRHVGF